jgi:ABC-type multidrug transport system fused ATPase/permease subunit
MRYYDPTGGQILINNTSMPEINIKRFRRNIGYVGQEPVLFSMTIAENIRLSNPNLTNE